MKDSRFASLLLVVSLCWAGCSGGSHSPAEGDETAGTRSWQVRGLFVRPSFEGEAIRVDHEAIPDFMGAMAMDIRLADPSLIDGLVAGDKIRFDLLDDDGMLLVTSVEKLPPETELELRSKAGEKGSTTK